MLVNESPLYDSTVSEANLVDVYGGTGQWFN
jgi:hypothetical protein